MVDPKLMQQVDACRPGSRDVQLPELGELAEALARDPEVRTAYQTVQRLDARMAAAFHDVPVPGGLADRILSRLGAADRTPAAASTGAGSLESSRIEAQQAAEGRVGVAEVRPLKSPSAAGASLAGPVERRWLTRRQAIRFGVAIAAGVLIAASVASLRQPTGSRPAITDEASNWYVQLGDAWQPLARAPQALAMPRGIAAAPRGWQPVARAVAAKGVVYDLGQGAGLKAVLFVLKAERADLPAEAPRGPQSMTAGLAIGAWQSGGLVYVLVVEGNEQTYQRLVHPRHPLA